MTDEQIRAALKNADASGNLVTVAHHMQMSERELRDMANADYAFSTTARNILTAGLERVPRELIASPDPVGDELLRATLDQAAADGKMGVLAAVTGVTEARLREIQGGAEPEAWERAALAPQEDEEPSHEQRLGEVHHTAHKLTDGVRESEFQPPDPRDD